MKSQVQKAHQLCLCSTASWLHFYLQASHSLGYVSAPHKSSQFYLNGTMSNKTPKY